MSDWNAKTPSSPTRDARDPDGLRARAPASIYAESWDAFLDALECLYIKDNISGRLKFRDQWQHAAHYLFGDDLMAHDADGTLDTQARHRCEEEALERRAALLQMLEDLEEKTVEGSAIKVSFVRDLIAQIGQDLARYIYSQRVMEAALPSKEAPPEREQPPSPVAAPEPVMPAPAAPLPDAPANKSRLPKVATPAHVDPPPALEDLPKPDDAGLQSMRAAEQGSHQHGAETPSSRNEDGPAPDGNIPAPPPVFKPGTVVKPVAKRPAAPKDALEDAFEQAEPPSEEDS